MKRESQWRLFVFMEAVETIVRKKGQVMQIREFFIDLSWLCHIRLKIAGEGMAFSVFL